MCAESSAEMLLPPAERQTDLIGNILASSFYCRLGILGKYRKRIPVIHLGCIGGIAKSVHTAFWEGAGLQIGPTPLGLTIYLESLRS
jgi:hypothetical protein